MQTADHQNPGRKIVIGLFAIGVIIALAGYKHRSAQQAAQVTWQDVSATLQNVEVAKRDLFQSMQLKSAQK